MTTEFERLYLGVWINDEEYDAVYRAWIKYYDETDRYDAQEPDRGRQIRHAQARYREILTPIQSVCDPEKFQQAKRAAALGKEQR
jgi:hypothetical protein